MAMGRGRALPVGGSGPPPDRNLVNRELRHRIPTPVSAFSEIRPTTSSAEDPLSHQGPRSHHGEQVGTAQDRRMRRPVTSRGTMRT